MTEQVKVTQADRDAAQALCASAWTHAGEAFARHRIAAQAELLEVLVSADVLILDLIAHEGVGELASSTRKMRDEYDMKLRAAIAKAKGEA